MAVQSTDFLEFAEVIYKKANTEIEYRNIVSRSYYSSLHAITRHLVNAPKKQSELIEYLRNKDEHSEEKINSNLLSELGLKLEQQKANRVKSDYHLWKRVSNYEAKNAIKEAKIFKSMIDDSLQQKEAIEA